MKKIKYKVISNEKITKNTTAAEFFSEFRFLFLADLVPPYIALKDLCKNAPDLWGGGNRLIWNKFDLEKTDYDEIIRELKSTLGLKLADVPSNIDSAYKWYIWQHEFKYSIPYDEHKELTDIENHYRKLLKEATESKDKEKQMIFHLKAIEAADNLADFVDPYLMRKD